LTELIPTAISLLIMGITGLYVRQQAKYTQKIFEESKHSRFASIYKDINLRFDEILQEFPPGVKKHWSLQELLTYSKKLEMNENRVHRAIIRYIYLTYLEYNLAKEGISQTYWNHWLKGIVSGFKSRYIQEVWKSEFLENIQLNTSSISEDFIQFIEDCINLPPEVVIKKYQNTNKTRG